MNRLVQRFQSPENNKKPKSYPNKITLALYSISLISSLVLSPNTVAYQETQQPALENETEEITSQDPITIERIKVSGLRNQAHTEVTLETQKLLKIAGIAHDPLSSVYSMPGVVYAGGDDGGEPAIRGSSPDDNAFYIDDMPAGYIFHLFGDSIFNENVVRDFSLHPAAFGSQYGNATGGVFDVQLRDPKNQELTTTLDASLMKTGIMLEGGLTEEQAFYFSYRRSLIHLFLPEGEEEDGLTVFKAPVSDDYQGKYQWLVGDDHKLTLTLAGASDVGGINISSASEEGRVNPDDVGDLKLKQRFDSQSVSWQYFGDGGKIMQVVLGHSTENEKQSFGSGQFINTDEEQYNLRLSYQIDWIKNHTLVLGSDFQHREFDYSFDTIPYYCTDHDADCESKKGERLQDTDQLSDKTASVYVTDTWQISPDWQAKLGLRAENNDYTDQSFLHHRMSLNWLATDDLTVSLKQGSYSRFPDLETVLRKVGNPKLKSPKAQHYAISFDYQLNDLWQSSLDFYYKDLGDLARSLDEDDVNAHLRYSDDMTGTAKGVEWVVERELNDDWYGWASISYSKSERTDVLSQATTDYYLDTPLLANVVANYQLNERWDFGLRLTVRSGQKYTPITGLRANPDHQDHFLPVYGELNSKTLPTYYRLDLQANYKTLYWGNNAEWTFAMLNATGSDNISGYYYAPDGTEILDSYTIEGEKGMEMFPSIGLKMTF